MGEFDKPHIRALAARAGLSTADKKDSQDICFIPDGDNLRFLREYGKITSPAGDCVDKAGKVLGRHDGIVGYTAGQRKGLGVSGGKRLYVISKDAEKNTVLLGDDEDLFAPGLLASRVNWIMGVPTGAMRCTAKTRYSQKECACTVTPCADGTVRVDFDAPQRAITAGQAVVFYDGDVVLGGGTIEGALE